MITKQIILLIIITSFTHEISARIWHSEDYLVMDEMTKSIGPKNDRILYFVRPNDVIPSDSLPLIINKLFKTEFDSIRVEKVQEIDYCGYHSNGHKINNYTYSLYSRRLLRHKYYSLHVYVDTTIGLFAISSLKWQYGFIEPPEKNNRFASNVKDRIIRNYPDVEYIGYTKMKYDINESNFSYYNVEGEFWEWFKKYEKYLFYYEKRPNVIEAYISRKLQIMGLDLSFEISSIIDGRRELEIYGPEYMRERVIKAVPTLQFWRIAFLNNSEKKQKQEEAREESRK